MLTKFKLVNHAGLKGLHFNGDNIPLDQLTDEVAEKLIGKTHVLERIAAPTLAVAAAQLAPAAEAAAPEAEAPATSRKRTSN